ncbi:hypothetical protein Hanom_Chr01g00009911 [Helianthus anomalus]
MLRFLLIYTLFVVRFDRHTQIALHTYLNTPTNRCYLWMIACSTILLVVCSLIAIAILKYATLNDRFLYSDCFMYLCTSMPYVLFCSMCSYVLTSCGVSLDYARLNRNSVLNPWRCLLQTMSSFGSFHSCAARRKHDDKRIASLVANQIVKVIPQIVSELNENGSKSSEESRTDAPKSAFSYKQFKACGPKEFTSEDGPTAMFQWFDSIEVTLR